MKKTIFSQLPLFALFKRYEDEKAQIWQKVDDDMAIITGKSALPVTVWPCGAYQTVWLVNERPQ